MKMAAILLLAFSLLLLIGCLSKVNRGTSLYEEEYKKGLSRVPFSLPNDTAECREGSCWCFSCKNGTPLFPSRTNMIGGSCYLEKNCTDEKLTDFNNRTKTPDRFLLPFMIGQGPTFGDFGKANTYSADQLSMTVQWLVGSADAPYLLPDARRSMCFLSKGVMPVFILYSNGTDINEARSREIAEILGTQGKDQYGGKLSTGPVGPVIIVAEMNFDASQAYDVARQVRAIDEGCRNVRGGGSADQINCFIAVGPKMNDFAALEAVQTALGEDGWGKVDFVAYGVDGSYASHCKGDKVVFTDAWNMSRISLYNYTKPTLIPYVLFDQGSFNRDRTCNWTENEVLEAYKSFFPNNMLQLQRRGLIGVAPYTFNTTGNNTVTNPLHCADCALGKSQARMDAWYGSVQSYLVYTRAGGETANSGNTQIRFGNESGTACNQGSDLTSLLNTKYAGKNILQPETSATKPPLSNVYACDACVIDNITRSESEYFPSLVAWGDAAFGADKEKYCSSIDEVQQWSSAHNLDPMFVRAIIVGESRFDPCTAAMVCKAGYEDPKCFNQGPGEDECYQIGYDLMVIPDGTPDCAIQLLNDPAPPGQPNYQPKWRWCALGILQSLEPPISFWPAEFRNDSVDGPYVDYYNKAGLRGYLDMAAAHACNSVNFNPFSISDSLCVGTAKLEKMKKESERLLTTGQYQQQLNWDLAKDADKTRLFAHYMMAQKYGGYWDQPTRNSSYSSDPRNAHPCASGTPNGECWLSNFRMAWNVTTAYCQSADGQANPVSCLNGAPRRDPPYACFGETDFMKYMKDCEAPWLKGGLDVGRTKIEIFLGLLKGCENSMCPDGKKYFALTEKPLPTSGTPYVPDNPNP
ncbi:MAG: hypothetical protein V1827_03330 [Candidatus Micrarchaeota archaeon]